VALVLDAAVVPAIESSGVLLVAIGAILAAVGAFTRSDPREGLPTWFGTVFGALYASLLGFVLRLGHAAPPLGDGAPLAAIGADRGWIVLLVLAVWSYDTGAYAVGRRFGRRRFMAHVSPGKTLEGVGGGLVAAAVVASLMVMALGRPVLLAVPFALLTAAAAQAGDLAESMLKRAAGAKDSGRLIPGHGGILDRVDSFLFAAPVALLYVLAAYR
jgi:phosphatidate cytidylyltransferase